MFFILYYIIFIFILFYIVLYCFILFYIILYYFILFYFYMFLFYLYIFYGIFCLFYLPLCHSLTLLQKKDQMAIAAQVFEQLLLELPVKVSAKKKKVGERERKEERMRQKG